MINTQSTHQLPGNHPHTDLWQSGYIRCSDERRKTSLLMRNPRCGRQSHGLIQQSSPCSDTWLGTFCLHSRGNQPLGVDGWHALCPRNHKQENLWWLNHLIAWKYSSAHREAEPLTLELWWSQELPNHCRRFFFFILMLLLGDQTFIMWITLDMMGFWQAWHLNALHYTKHYALQIYLGCKKSGKSNEKSWTEWQKDHRKQLGGRLDACRGADIECSHKHCWWETTCFLWSTATCIVEVISPFTSLLGCFTIKAL